jgi:hypothetical protein
MLVMNCWKINLRQRKDLIKDFSVGKIELGKEKFDKEKLFS